MWRLLLLLIPLVSLFAQGPKPLRASQTVDAEISAPSADEYSISLASGELLHLALEEKQLYLGIEVRDPAGALVAKSNRHRAWKEDIVYSAVTAGTYAIRVTTTKL